ncbi:ExbD/TolR family protein [Pseudochryseolinea flava]|uniref:Biopolymer transporter ExbD n=1 Tax=Pseudochryseolinea flava TaxID=2059302 RepID=A0A364XZ25_9BACT|nr:biopolymer transporter ExbD [Pseudochryseolinea flava]RAV99059.1 biopolymer transporter ExbD [Pseudochryseolinea flava]
MGKIKTHRTTPSLDMTPMVDLGFLLVTFFMLTANAVPDEPVTVDAPSSVSEIIIPDTDIMLITISDDGRVFFSIDGKYHRQELLGNIGKQYSVNFTPEETSRFAVMSSIGLPIGQLREYISLAPDERKHIKQPGIPVDSLHNELKDWIIFSRMANPKLRIAIKGDGKANYPVVEKVMKTLTDNKVNRFNLITNMEKGS